MAEAFRTVVVCCDGTGNQFGTNNTNVVKFFQHLDLSDPDCQVGYYDPGVGTFDYRDKGSHSELRKLLGLAFGRGVRENVCDAYRYLMDWYGEGPADVPNRVVIVGFSRGAHTARALAAMLATIGLLKPGNLNLVDYAYEMYKAPSKIGLTANEREEQRTLQARFKETYCRDCPVEMVGVWDTVATIILPLQGAGRFFGGLLDGAILTPLRALFGLSPAPLAELAPRVWLKESWNSFFQGFSDQVLSHHVGYGYQACALDEDRRRFQLSLWDEPGTVRSAEEAEASPPEIEQVWFSGYHSDVGGWWPSEGLSNITLHWMMVRAERRGVRFNRGWADALTGSFDVTAPIHNTRDLMWWAADIGFRAYRTELPYTTGLRGWWHRLVAARSGVRRSHHDTLCRMPARVHDSVDRRMQAGPVPHHRPRGAPTQEPYRPILPADHVFVPTEVAD